MPNPVAIFFKSILAFALAAAAFYYGGQVRQVEVTVIANGQQHRVAVRPDDPAYREELKAARKRSWPFYGAGVLLALAGISLLGKSVRVARKQRKAAQPRYQRQF